MLIENFQISEVQHYRILTQVALYKKKKTFLISNKSLNITSMSAINRMGLLKFCRSLFVLLISVFQMSNSFGYADVISLTASCGNYSDETLIRLENQSTYNFDGNWDAYKLTNKGSTPNFYSTLNDTKYAINSIPRDFDEYTMELNLSVAFSGYYTITTTSLLNSASDSSYIIVLEDKFLNKMQTLEENMTYSFDAAPADLLNRFTLHYQTKRVKSSLISAIISAKEEINYDLTLTSEGANISFNNISSESASILVISMGGKVIFLAENISTQTVVTIPKDVYASEAVYLIRIIIGKSAFSEKIYF